MNWKVIFADFRYADYPRSNGITEVPLPLYLLANRRKLPAELKLDDSGGEVCRNLFYLGRLRPSPFKHKC